MSRLFRCIGLILSIAILLAIPVSAAERGEQISTPYASNFFSITSTYLHRVSDTKFQVWYEVHALRGMDELGVSTIKVQRSADGVNWSTMQTFTMDLTTSMIAYNTGAHSGYINYYGTPGYYYRAYVCFYAKEGTSIGELDRYTSSMIL